LAINLFNYSSQNRSDMKKHVSTIITAAILVFIATSCNEGKHENMDSADTTTMPAETTLPAGTPADGKDTAIAPPVDPAMDTSASQTPKI
jgi:hypothetical protein